MNAQDVRNPPLVSIVDDDRLVRVSLELLIRSAGWQAASFASAEEFLACPRALRLGCLISEVSLPQLGGLALQEILKERKETPVVFLTEHHDIGMTVRAMKAGAVDFLTKPVCAPAILNAVQCALDRSRHALVEESAMRSLNHRRASLTPREREVLERVVAGFLNKQIGADLGISEITVKAHRGKVMRKMGAASLAELVRMSASHQFASWPAAPRVVQTDTIVQYQGRAPSVVIRSASLMSRSSSCMPL